MKEGKVIGRIFVPKGKEMKEIVIRFPEKKDLHAIRKFYNRVIKETDFLSRINPVTIEDERNWLKGMLDGIKKRNRIYLAAEHKNKIVGSVTIERKTDDVSKHVGNYGICILQDYTGLGLGSKLTECAIEFAKKEMRLEIIVLSVYDKNKIAQRLYRKVGFVYAGKIPRSIKRKARYMDNIIMYKVLK